jgi:hypothetical protein
MPRRPDGRIEPGQKLASAISARAWNRAQDAADIVLGERTRFGAEAAATAAKSYTEMLGVNNTQATVSIYQPVHYSLATSLQEFGDASISLSSPVSPASPWLYPFGVALEPILPNKFGRVAVSGIVRCRVELTGLANNAYAILNFNAQQATRNPSGCARLLSSGSGEFQLVHLDQHSYTVFVDDYEPSWVINQEAQLTQAGTNNTFTGINYHVNLPAGPKRLVFAGPPETPGGRLVLVAAQCESG